IVENRSDINRIKNNDNNGQTTSVNELELKPILETSYGVLREACNVLERAEANSNQTKEECSIVDFDLGLSVRSQTGESQSADLPRVPDGMSTPVSIHSHDKYNDATQMSGHHADNSGDADHFGDFVQNVIVGPLGVDGPSGLAFYPNTSKKIPPMYKIRSTIANKIISQQTTTLLNSLRW
ncbi:MAG: hypothetical protein MJZ34_15865, partial [Paludibacteraceae bacterium]|nr:hypothetical protein [Paludibacteraceae bacterium]